MRGKPEKKFMVEDDCRDIPPMPLNLDEVASKFVAEQLQKDPELESMLVVQCRAEFRGESIATAEHAENYIRHLDEQTRFEIEEQDEPQYVLLSRAVGRHARSFFCGFNRLWAPVFTYDPALGMVFQDGDPELAQYSAVLRDRGIDVTPMPAPAYLWKEE
jgi:hypothetical protein